MIKGILRCVVIAVVFTFFIGPCATHNFAIAADVESAGQENGSGLNQAQLLFESKRFQNYAETISGISKKGFRIPFSHLIQIAFCESRGFKVNSDVKEKYKFQLAFFDFVMSQDIDRYSKNFSNSFTFQDVSFAKRHLVSIGLSDQSHFLGLMSATVVTKKFFNNVDVDDIEYSLRSDKAIKFAKYLSSSEDNGSLFLALTSVLRSVLSSKKEVEYMPILSNAKQFRLKTDMYNLDEADTLVALGRSKEAKLLLEVMCTINDNLPMKKDVMNFAKENLSTSEYVDLVKSVRKINFRK